MSENNWYFDVVSKLVENRLLVFSQSMHLNGCVYWPVAISCYIKVQLVHWSQLI